jgi:peptidoglycan-associated lipoprotein
MISPLGGCAQKSASIEPTEQTAKVEDTGNAGSAGANQPLAPIASVGPDEGGGPSESLDTPPPSREELYGQAGTPGFVEGSRTSLGVAPVYFEYNKFTIRPDQAEKIRANALFLKDNPAKKARIEGNCDDRGTYEYNMALGEWRAMSAKKYLINLGIDDERLTTLSYGEERPVKHGQDEVARAENRRDDFVITQ